MFGFLFCTEGGWTWGNFEWGVDEYLLDDAGSLDRRLVLPTIFLRPSYPYSINLSGGAPLLSSTLKLWLSKGEGKEIRIKCWKVKLFLCERIS